MRKSDPHYDKFARWRLEGGTEIPHFLISRLGLALQGMIPVYAVHQQYSCPTSPTPILRRITEVAY